MPLLTSSKSLALADFKSFSEQSGTSDTAIIGKKFFGTGHKKISSLSVQRISGETSSTVADFKKALSKTYGADIADFAFSAEEEQTALSKGLNKKTITAVLRKASQIKDSSFKDDFFAYQQAILTKQQSLERHIEQLPEGSHADIKKKYSQINEAWADCADLFDTWSSNNSEETSQSLKNYFQAKLQFTDQLAREILFESAKKIIQQELNLPPAEAEETLDLLQQNLGLPLAENLMRPLADHTAFTETTDNMLDELGEESDLSEKLFHLVEDSEETNALSNHQPLFKKFLENLTLIPEILKTKTDTLCQQLQPFVVVPSSLSSKSFFYLQDEAIATHPPTKENSPSSPTEEQKRAAAHQFFSALKEFYGTELIDHLVSIEQQEQPLTIEQSRLVLHKISKTLEGVGDFLKENPIIITPEYLYLLAHNLEAAQAAQKNYEQLGVDGNSLIHNLREIGLCGMIYSGTKIGLTIAGACVPTAPCILLALGAAAADGYVIGRWVTREDGYSENTQQTGGRIGAISTVGSAVGIIAQRTFQQVVPIPIPDIISSTVAEYGGSYLALKLRSAACSGAQTAIDQNSFNPESLAPNPVSIEPRIIQFFGLGPYVEKLWNSISNLGGLIGTSSPPAGTAE